MFLVINWLFSSKHFQIFHVATINLYLKISHLVLFLTGIYFYNNVFGNMYFT